MTIITLIVHTIYLNLPYKYILIFRIELTDTKIFAYCFNPNYIYFTVLQASCFYVIVLI